MAAMPGWCAARKARALLQPGNGLTVQWRARLAEQLGSYHPGTGQARAGALMEDARCADRPQRLHRGGRAALPEHQAHRRLFDAAAILLDAMTAEDFAHWGPLYVRWEAGLLEALGFGLDLPHCAATGADRRPDLCLAAQRAGGVARRRRATMPSGCWRCRVSCWARQNVPDLAATRAGLKLTGHFLLERVLAAHGREMPQARLRLDALASQSGRESE